MVKEQWIKTKEAGVDWVKHNTVGWTTWRLYYSFVAFLCALASFYQSKVYSAWELVKLKLDPSRELLFNQLNGFTKAIVQGVSQSCPQMLVYPKTGLNWRRWIKTLKVLVDSCIRYKKTLPVQQARAYPLSGLPGVKLALARLYPRYILAFTRLYHLGQIISPIISVVSSDKHKNESIL